MKKNHNKTDAGGFSLPETLMAMFLMGIFLTVISQVISDYSKSMRKLDEEDALIAMYSSLNTIADEIREANEVIAPSLGGVDNKISFRRRIPPFETSDYPLNVNSYDYGEYLKDPTSETPAQIVEYSVESGILYRKVFDADTSALLSKTETAKNINCLTVEETGSHGLYTLTFTYLVNNRPENISTAVNIRAKK